MLTGRKGRNAVCSAVLDLLSKTVVIKCEYVDTLAYCMGRYILALGTQKRARHWAACCTISEVNVR